MAIDAYDLARVLAPRPDGDYLKGRFGTVMRTHDDGTADVLIDGSTKAQRLTNWGKAPEGSRCVVILKGSSWFILSSSSGEGGLLLKTFGFNSVTGTVSAVTTVPLTSRQGFYHTSSSGVDVRLSHVVSDGIYTVSGVTPGMSIWVGEA